MTPLRTAKASTIAPIGSIRFINAIGSFSVRAFFSGGFNAFSYSGNDAGDVLFRTLVKWTDARDITEVELTIGSAPVSRHYF